MPIHFGTDGWRAVISDSFTFDNLRIVTQAVADAVASEHWDKSANGGNTPDKKKIVVGFDTRFLSDRFAGEVARVLAANGFSVLLAQADSPTPVISAISRNERFATSRRRNTSCWSFGNESTARTIEERISEDSALRSALTRGSGSASDSASGAAST